MTAAELKIYIANQLAIPVNHVSQVINALYGIVDFASAINTDLIPDWSSTKTFKPDGTGNGRYCKYLDNNDKKRIFETRIDDNKNNPPPADPLISENNFWLEISPSESASIPEWTPGLYGSGLIIVYYSHSVDGKGLYLLNEATRPFNSTNIETEIVSKQWSKLGSLIDGNCTTANGTSIDWGGTATRDTYIDMNQYNLAIGGSKINGTLVFMNFNSDGIFLDVESITPGSGIIQLKTSDVSGEDPITAYINILPGQIGIYANNSPNSRVRMATVGSAIDLTDPKITLQSAIIEIDGGAVTVPTNNSVTTKAYVLGPKTYTGIQTFTSIAIKAGANATVGKATLVAGTVTVNTNKVTANSVIQLTSQNTSGTEYGDVRISSRTPGVSFVITSYRNNNSMAIATGDTSDVGWVIIELAP